MLAAFAYHVVVSNNPGDELCAFDGPAIYQIVVDGLVARSLSDRLQGMSISQANDSGTTKSTLQGELEDQAALAGVLSTLYNLRFTLLAVAIIAPDDQTAPISGPGVNG